MNNIERMERVNALAAQAKTDRAVIPELWGMVEKLIRVICLRYCRPDQNTRLYEYDDLCQSAYFGFIKAIDSYDPERGAFSNHLIFFIRKMCSKEIGRYGSKIDPLFKATSIDAPLPFNEADDFTLGDMIGDSQAEQPFEDVDDQIYKHQLHAALDDCMTRIPEDYAYILRSRYYDGATLESIATVQGVSRESVRQRSERALENMRQPENIGRLLPFWQKNVISESLRYVGPAFFKTHWYSSVEWAAERIMMGDKRNDILDKIGVVSRSGKR